MRKIVMTLMFAFGLVICAKAQTTVSGRVTDANGKPVPNVSVTVKGSKVGTSTAADGTYSLTAPASAKIIEFSSVGFESQAATISSKKFSPVLRSSAKEGAEVVITGITKVKKSEYTGASTKIDEKQIKDRPVGSFDQILQGRVPGVSLLTSSGQPGTSSTVIIRGQGSVLGGTDPFYVVDGIPVEAGVFQGLNPNDFASIDILRDAAATSLYGSRASAGVIVITTKKGSMGRLKVGYGAQFGVKSKPDFAFKPMNSTQLLQAQEDYGKIIGAPADLDNLPGYYYSPFNPRYASLSPAAQASYDQILDSLKNTNTNWQNEFFRPANFSNHQITLSGGAGKTRVYSSLGLYNEEGITLRTDMKRVTLMNNFDYVDDKVTYSVFSNFGFTRRSYQQSSDFNTSNPFASSVLTPSYFPVRNSDGSYATGGENTLIQSAPNNLEQTELDRNYNNQIKATIGITVGYKITNNISAGVTTGVDFRETQSSRFGNPLAHVRQISTSPTYNAGSQSESLNRFFTANVRPTIGYKKVINTKHDLDVNVYGEYIREKSKNIGFTGYGTNPKTPNTPAAITQGDAVNELFAVVSGGKSENSLLGGLLTAKYTYNKKYSFSGSFRNDWSSKLPQATRSQSFYSLGGVWDAGKEDFISNINFFNNLRVKLSYGSSGNANNFPGGDYPYQAPYAQGNYNGNNTIYATDPGNPNLKWERTYLTNLGIDFEMFKRRIYGDINIYDKTTKDLFVQLSLSATGGFGSGYPLVVNAGTLSNKGIEWNINADVIRNENLTVTLFTNGGYNKNNVKDLGGVSSFEQGTELIKVGLPLGSHYQVGWAGVDAASGQELYYNANGQVTNQYNASDAVQKWGTWEAPWKGGFGGSVSYKAFDLSVLFSWQKGSTKVDNMQFFLENPSGFLSQGFNQSSDLQFWQQPGDVVSSPSPLSSVNFSSKFIHDASFLRMRDVRLSYNFSKATLLKSKFLSSASLYIAAQNLFIWTKWRGLDPEAGAVNINLSEFPNPRAITAGLEVNF